MHCLTSLSSGQIYIYIYTIIHTSIDIFPMTRMAVKSSTVLMAQRGGLSRELDGSQLRGADLGDHLSTGRQGRPSPKGGLFIRVAQ